ncbi:hypothetical protein B0H19DRAFT_937432, partial [Mycena capillaripes]
EDEVHTLFDCTGNPRLVELQSQFLDLLKSVDTVSWESYMKMSNYDFMLKIFPLRKAVALYAKYIFLVLSIFDETPRYFPVVFKLPA